MRITCLLECDDIMHAAESDSRIGYTVYAKEKKKNPLFLCIASSSNKTKTCWTSKTTHCICLFVCSFVCLLKHQFGLNPIGLVNK